MSIERMPTPPAASEMPPATGDSTTGSATVLPVAVKLQILATEHWSLLATRSLTWNESFSRSSMFLSALSGSVVALALVAQASTFGEAFEVFSLVLLPVVFFLGVGTYVRLVQANLEDARWVSGMNRLRHAYLDLAPELDQYFITAHHDDEIGLVTTAAAGGRHAASGTGGPAVILQGLVTTPVTIAVIDSVVGAVLVAMIGTRMGSGMAPSLGLGILAFAVTFASMAVYYFRSYRAYRAANEPRFPTPPENT
jgi:hypothetical protein